LAIAQNGAADVVGWLVGLSRGCAAAKRLDWSSCAWWIH